MAAEPVRIDGKTPNGGDYALVFTHADGTVEIVEYRANGDEVFRTYGSSPTGRTLTR